RRSRTDIAHSRPAGCWPGADSARGDQTRGDLTIRLVQKLGASAAADSCCDTKTRGTRGALTASSETTKSPACRAYNPAVGRHCQNHRPCSTVAGRTRLLDRCRTCREADRQATGTVVLLSEVVDRDSSEGSTKRWPRRTSPHTPPCAWARGYFDGLTGPVAE